MKPIHSYIKEGIVFQVDAVKNMFTAIFSNGRKGTGPAEKAALESALGFEDAGTCAQCKQTLNGKYPYLNFAGDNLHTDCLVDYLQALGVLKAVVPKNTQES